MQLFHNNLHLTSNHQQLWRKFMLIAGRPLRRALLFAGITFLLVLSAYGAERSRIKATDYNIDVEITPKTHLLTAHARVKFTALDDINFATFELNNALRVTRVL